MKTFHICTLVNNDEQYQAMRASFARARFDEDRCRFSFFDNRSANTHECYSTFNHIMADTSEPYIIYCHQDILLDQGCGCEELINIIQSLDRNDPRWAVLGNAGVTEDHRVVLRMRDPFENDCGPDTEPEKVCSLDENFLLIKTASNIRCSSGLSGFHLYATDLCLHAMFAGFACYVVNFRLTHLSMGEIDKSFEVARKNLQLQWSHQFKFRYLKTTCTTIFLGRNNALRFFFSSYRITHYLLSNPVQHKIACWISDTSYAT